MRYNLPELNPDFKPDLNKLKNIRNLISHGDSCTPLDYKAVEDLIHIVNELMEEFIQSLSNYLENWEE